MYKVENMDLSLFAQNFFIVLAVLVLAISAAYYLKSQPNSPKGVNLIIAGFSALIISKALLFMHFFLDKTEILAFLETVFSSLAAVIFVTAGLMLRKVKAATETFTYVLFTAVLFVLVYAYFIVNAEYLQTLLHYLTLGIGYAFLAYGFTNHSTEKSYFGFSIASFGLFLLSALNFILISMWGRENFDSINLYVFLNFIVVVGFVLAANNLLSDKIDALNEEIVASQSRLRLIIQSSPFPIIISRLRDDRLILVNQKAEELFGIDITKLSDYKLEDFFSNANFKTELMSRLERSNKIEAFDVALKNSKYLEDETWLQLSTHVIDFEYEITLYSAFQDITERKKKELELFHEATRDPLTGAYTRRFFEELAGKEIQRSIRYNRPFCLLMIDADHFKNVNDTYGHSVGDKVLKELVNTCNKVLRKTDVICRYGGEEFFVLLMEVDVNVAQIVADRLRAVISNVVVKSNKGEDVKFTVSMGLVPSTYSTNYTELIKAADEALYVAKNSGRNKVIALTPQEVADKKEDKNPMPAIAMEEKKVEKKKNQEAEEVDAIS